MRPIPSFCHSGPKHARGIHKQIINHPTKRNNFWRTVRKRRALARMEAALFRNCVRCDGISGRLISLPGLHARPVDAGRAAGGAPNRGRSRAAADHCGAIDPNALRSGRCDRGRRIHGRALSEHRLGCEPGCASHDCGRWHRHRGGRGRRSLARIDRAGRRRQHQSDRISGRDFGSRMVRRGQAVRTSLRLRKGISEHLPQHLLAGGCPGFARVGGGWPAPRRLRACARIRSLSQPTGRGHCRKQQGGERRQGDLRPVSRAARVRSFRRHGSASGGGADSPAGPAGLRLCRSRKILCNAGTTTSSMIGPISIPATMTVASGR